MVINIIIVSTFHFHNLNAFLVKFVMRAYLLFEN